MKSIKPILSLFLLGTLAFSSCKKEEMPEDPYSSITNLTQIASLNPKTAEHKLIKNLVLNDGYLIVNNIYYPNGTIAAELTKLNKEKQALWTQEYAETGYKYEAVDVTSATGSYYLALNSKPLIGEYSSAKILMIDQSGSILQEKEFKDSANVHHISAGAISYDPLGNAPAIMFAGNTTNLDTFPSHYYYTDDSLDNFTIRMDLDLSIVWENYIASYNTGNELPQEIINTPEGVLVYGYDISKSNNVLPPALPFSINKMFISKYSRDSGHISFPFSNHSVDLYPLLIDLVYDAKNQRIYIFSMDPSFPVAMISKTTFDENMEQISGADYMDLATTEFLEYCSVRLLSDGTFLLSLEKPKNAKTQNIEWIRMTSEGTVHSHYSFNDSDEEYIESIGTIRNPDNTAVYDIDLCFPVLYGTGRNLGIYELDLNSPNQ